MTQQQPIYQPQMASIVQRINNPARLIQCIQMHNEEEFAPIVLKSIYDEVDQILVIEGAVTSRSNSTPDGHSTDKTADIIKDFKKNYDSKNKVTFISIKKPWKDLEELKQSFIDFSSDSDWLIINDADELYHPADIRRVRKAIELNPHACEFIPTFLHFYRDFKHLYAPAPEWQPQHQRIFKVQRGMKYNSHPIVTLPDGYCSYFSPHIQHRRFLLNNFFIYHYGYARLNMDQRMQEKQQYYEKELSKHANANVKFDAKLREWLDRSESANNILKFPLDRHPVVIGEHPMFQYTDEYFASRDSQFKDWSEDRLYSKVLKNEPYGNIWLCMNMISPPAMQLFHNQINID